MLRHLRLLAAAFLLVAGCGGDRNDPIPASDGLLETIPVGTHIQSLGFNAQGTRLALYSGVQLRIYRVLTGRLLLNYNLLPCNYGCGFTPSSVAWSHDGVVVAAGPLDTLFLMDALRQDVHRKLEYGDPFSSIRSVAFSPDDRLVYVGGQSSNVCVFDVASGVKLRSQNVGDADALTLSPDGKVLATGSFARKVILWSTETWSPQAELDLNSHFVTDMAFDDTGRHLAVCGSYTAIYFWDTVDDSLLWSVDGLPFGSASSISFSPDGRYLVTDVSPREIGILDAADGTILDRWTAHEKDLMRCQLSPDGRFIASSSYDLTVKIWDMATRMALLGSQ
jgi:WD40 repeat protein